MGKQTAQGTRWESRLRDKARELGRRAMRLPKTGKKSEPDLVIHPQANTFIGEPFIGELGYRPAVAWERWVGKKSEKRRRAVRMVTVTEDHFYELLDSSPYGYYIQCKSTQAGSLSSWVEGLIERMEEDGLSS